MVYYTKLTSTELQKLRDWMRKVQEEKASISYVQYYFLSIYTVDFQILTIQSKLVAI